jgi:membrane fusion protein, multidrug efflux system
MGGLMFCSNHGKVLLFPVFLLLLVLVAAWFSYNKYKEKELTKLNPGQVPVEVSVISVVRQDVPLIKEWIGTTQGDINAEIFAKVSGYLLKKNYTEGSFVQEGDVLFEIDARPYQAALDQAQGVLEQAISNQKKSQEDVKRYASLVKEGAVSRKEYGDAVRTNDMNKAAVNSAGASLEQARLNLDWTKVTAPISGVSGLAIAQVGDLIDSGKKLTTISATDPIKVSFPISENEYIWYQKMHIEKDEFSPDADISKDMGADSNKFQVTDAEISLKLNDGSIYPEKGEIAFTDRQIDSTTGTMTVQAKFPNAKGFLRPGQYAKILAKIGIFKDVLVVPRKAVIETQGVPQLAVVNKDNKVEIKNVKLGYISGNNRVVESGIENGDLVVVEGFLKIKEGSIVDPKKE